MSPDEKLILIQTDTKPIYRHSFTAEYYIYNVKNNKMEPLSKNGPQQVPLFSPDGFQVAFVRNNNIFLVKLLFGNSESQVTKDGEYNKVLNGIPDWVYEEEFSFNRAFDFSADSKMIAYIRFDESQVPMFSFPWYKGMAPEKSQYATYPGAYEYKYPKAGEMNSKVSVHTYDIKSHVTRKMDLPLDEDGYIPRIKFTSDPEKLAIMTLNRHQNRFDIYMANPRSALCKLTIRDEAEQYIKEQAYSDIVFYPENIVMMSERDGYNHLYLYTIGGNLIKQVTKGKFEVKDFLGWDKPTNTFYYTSNEESPLRTAVYKTDAKGKTINLSTRTGTNSAIFSTNLSYYINNFSNIDTPTLITINNNKGKELTTLLDNSKLKSEVATLNMPKKEFFSFRTTEGVELNGWMMKETSVGRVIVNEIVPAEVGYLNTIISKKSLRDIISDVIKAVGVARACEFLDGIKNLGYHMAFKGGLSFNLGDIIIPKEKEELVKRGNEEVEQIMMNYNMGFITDNERYNQVIDTWTHVNSDLSDILYKTIKNDDQGFNSVFMMLDSGARGSKEQIRQLSESRC